MNDPNKPVAWAVTPTGKDEEIDCEFVYPDAATAGDVALGCNGVVVPLYRQPTLTDAERAALRDAIGFYINEWGATNDLVVNDSPICRTLRGLLERLRGEQ
jgi:hypothetical protein